MKQSDIDQLQNEKARGEAAKRAYDSFIKTFVQDKRVVLFEAFQSTPAVNKDDLMEIKRMAVAINALDQEIKTIIETGQMASVTLEEEEKE